MFLVFGILFTIAGCGVGLLTLFAEGMSDAPGTSLSKVPALLLLAIAAGCFVARHYLHGHALTL